MIIWFIRALGLLCPWWGAEILVYSLDGHEPLTVPQSVGCFLIAVPFGLIVAILVELMSDEQR